MQYWFYTLLMVIINFLLLSYRHQQISNKWIYYQDKIYIDILGFFRSFEHYFSNCKRSGHAVAFTEIEIFKQENVKNQITIILSAEHSYLILNYILLLLFLTGYTNVYYFHVDVTHHWLSKEISSLHVYRSKDSFVISVRLQHIII